MWLFSTSTQVSTRPHAARFTNPHSGPRLHSAGVKLRKIPQKRQTPAHRFVTMLVLSRKLNEQIMIGDDIVLTIVDIRGDKVRLGIDAPGEVPVHRREVYLALKNAKSTPADASEAS